MSAAGGARIGTRGPGETQLEVDRRRIVRRIHKLEAELREHRPAPGRPSARPSAAASSPRSSIVGYTNAGKSTLLNRLTDAGVLVEDRLFATLDATTRRLELPGGEAVLLTDTVGFIRKLPHQLVEAFRSTLDVVVEADLLVHVVDASRPRPGGNIAAVRDVLAEIGAGDVPELLAFNKSDLGPDEAARLRRAPTRARWRLSAVTGEGVDGLLRHDRRPAAGADRRWSSWSSRTTGATCWPPPTARARCSSRRRARAACACAAASTTRGRPVREFVG